MSGRVTPQWLIATMIVLSATLLSCSSDEEPERAGEAEAAPLGHRDLGPEPFVDVIGGTPSADVAPLVAEAARAADDAAALVDPSTGTGTEVEIDRMLIETRLAAATDVFSEAGEPLIRPRSAAGAAVVPGDGDEVCEIETMIELYEADPGAAAAFAEVQGISVEGIPTFLRSLTTGYLIDEIPVINHRYRDGGAVPVPTTLVAGTAVAVDADGLPRVRCRCGNPLVPTRVELGDLIVAAEAFADRVHEATIADDVPAERYDSIDGLFTDHPAQALGPPNRVAVSLGDDPDAAEGRCRYRIVLEFVDNRLVDGPGDDLQIIELGRSESTYVSVGVTMDDLRPVGEITGGTTTIDLAPVTAAGDQFAFIELCDGPDTSSEVPGSDIDAVAALNSVGA